MQSVVATLLAYDGIATRAELAAAGHSPRELARSVHLGEAHRPRRGWYAHPSAPEELVKAIRVGGRMACLTAARSYGLWVLDDRRTHVHVPESASRLRSRTDRYLRLSDRAADGTCVHRELVAPTARSTRLRVSALEALAEIVRHGNYESSMVALDSAAHHGLLSIAQSTVFAAMLPAKFRPLLGEVRAEAESGLETLVRIRLLKVGVVAAIQVALASGIRVDLLVGDRLVIETDGREFHENPPAFEADRGRDLFLKAFGYEVLRLSYRQVVQDWPSCEATILRMIARNQDRWSA